jgi:Domain of unknown function (DUF222)
VFGSGFTVGTAVARAEPTPAPLPPGPVPAGAVAVRERPSRLGEVLPVDARDDAQIAADLATITAIEAALAAWRLELVATLASRRPACADRSPRSAIEEENGAPPPAGVSEFFPDELALVCNTSRTAAAVLHEHARTLLERLPATWGALADGLLDWPRARAIAGELGRPADGSDPAVIAAVEAVVLPQAGGLSVRRLRELARRELLARDAEAADRRRRQAQAAVDVRVRATGDGMAELVSGHTQPVAAAIRDRIDRLAWLVKTEDGDPRPIGVIRAEVLAQLVLRPGEAPGARVTAQLTLDAPLAALHDRLRDRLPDRLSDRTAPTPTGTVDGHAITAAHLRELLAELDLLGVRQPPGSTVQVAITGPDGALLGTATLPELRRIVARGCPAHGFTCACALLGRPPAVDRYRPTPAQRRFLAVRDRTCRHPGCTNPAAWSDLDHVISHAAGGLTDCTNLCCLCRRHHRLKTLTRGWRFTLDPDGTRYVTTPSGVTRVDRPPGHRPPGEHSPTEAGIGTGPPATTYSLHSAVLGRRSGDPEDPPPY